jgi:hypothetical protein
METPSRPGAGIPAHSIKLQDYFSLPGAIQPENDNIGVFTQMGFRATFSDESAGKPGAI